MSAPLSRHVAGGAARRHVADGPWDASMPIGGSGGGSRGMKQAQHALRRADAVCFDVDSTVIQEEGIDEVAVPFPRATNMADTCMCVRCVQFASFLGVADRVAEITASAMSGSMPFHEVSGRACPCTAHLRA